MAKRIPSALTYSVTIRKIEDYLIFSVKDWNLNIALHWPAGTPYSPKLRAEMSAAIEKCWVKVARSISERVRAGIPLPDPSKIALSTEKEKKVGRQIKPLTVKEVAAILGVSENSVRRIPKDLLRSRRTRGGHRRFSVGSVLAYQKLFDWKEEPLIMEKYTPEKSSPQMDA
jgi:hypothetical protein